ncbi:transportin MOS14-like isoform X2 [Actinidia eriantha]|uniref:transportin MOS14-like isoform X2 n=1 Tax=Actinidia eriantha TaxID=165200 RepID=UPI002582F255|nr:transportin MOS14-like isoform X2 [Actinidia eriantha]XP_057514794.1 transportin MOS14-like isoform X2 [Actinidia eriantha]
MELQNTVKEALNALYHHPDDAVRMQADRWLQEFQRTIDAWQVSDNLLHDASSNQETLIFCSQTLRSKVQRDFEELPSEAFRPLRDSLNSLLKTFHKGPPKVRTQISLAVAALAVHVPAKDWGDGGIVNWLRDEMNSHPECIPSFLELLRVLPEEAFNYKIAARPDRRRQFEKELASAMEVALNILTACLSINELKEQVLEALASWLRLRHRIPASMLSSHPLVLTALSSLNSDILLEASVNVISELIHYTAARNSGGVAAQMPLIQVIVPQVMSLKAQLRDSSKDEEDVKAIARLFADMGDSYLELIANGSDESMLIVHALLEVASHPEYDIASMTFNFWHNLQIHLIERDSYISFGNETSIEAERSRRLLGFRSSYESLVSLVSFRVKYPQDYADLSREDLKDFKQTRYDVADVLIDAALVLGGEATLKILYMKLVEAVGSCGNDEHSDWRPAEAALYCIWAISDYVSVTEAEVMPQMMSLLPKLPHQPQLLTTVCLTVGAYSKWLHAAPTGLSFLPSLIDILVSGMSMSEDSAAAAALAFRHICNDCGKRLCGSLDGLFHIYQRAMIGEGTFKVSAEDSLHLVEALSVVITEVPSDHAKKALEVLCLTAVTPLQEIINQGPLVLGQTPARELTVHIDRLANIFRYVNHPEAVADAIQRLWPIFKAIFDLRAWDMRTMESLCRACKNAVRTSKRFMGITIGAMLEEIQGLYKQHHQSCFLYLSSEVIKIFGSDPSCADYLKNLIESLFSHTICLLKKIQDFTSRPDIADDCFLLASRCIRYCPHLFFPSAVFSSLVDCSLIGITVQHREASNSILTFLSDIFDLAKSSQGEKYISIRDSVILPRGATITRILVASVTGALPSSRLETVIYALLALTRVYGPRAIEWAKDSVSLIPSTAVTEVERTRFLQALSDVASGIDINPLAIPIEELSEVCRRNRTVQEIVQGALRPLELNLVNGIVA